MFFVKCTYGVLKMKGFDGVFRAYYALNNEFFNELVIQVDFSCTKYVLGETAVPFNL